MSRVPRGRPARHRSADARLQPDGRLAARRARPAAGTAALPRARAPGVAGRHPRARLRWPRRAGQPGGAAAAAGRRRRGVSGRSLGDARPPADVTTWRRWRRASRACSRSGAAGGCAPQHGTFLDRGFRRSFYLLEELTEELRQSEKAAYEKLIRMLSHEVNNTVGASNSLLNSCLSYASQLQPDDRADFEHAHRRRHRPDGRS